MIVAAEPVEVVAASGSEALAALRSLTPGWWAGFIAFDIGRVIEPVATRLGDDDGLPDLLLARYDARAIVGKNGVRYAGTRRARQRLQHLVRVAPTPGPVDRLGPSTSSLSAGSYQAGVREIIGLIEAGDCYQVNLTRRVTWPDAHPVALGAALRDLNPAPHESVLVLPHPDGSEIGVVSASPERFLSWDRGMLETRPIKGTDTRAARLLASAKDRAENVMIVDLARNDFGRCCEPGSVNVSELCGAEHHPGLVHLVSTVRGRRRAGVDLSDVVRATFPPASVTGAPKPRVLQVIEDLEPCRRGVYCGAVGWIDTEHDRGDLAVAIRTFTITHGETRLGTGAGIVADSDPVREWEETELKVARLSRVADGQGAEHVRLPA
ncbi:MAG TPA: anthranilate synthase component I family protein [Acidimicrobiia bacterium]|nr:anthranilate synthase component I family protein [Acidimicrobiia bacterium]